MNRCAGVTIQIALRFVGACVFKRVRRACAVAHTVAFAKVVDAVLVVEFRLALDDDSEFTSEVSVASTVGAGACRMLI